MKSHILKYIIVGTVIVMTSSCDSMLDTMERYNVDPNNPSVATNQVILPNVQMNLLWSNLGGDLSWYASVWVQHTTGVHAQLRDYDQLRDIVPTVANNTWNSMYTEVLKNLNIMREQGRELEELHHVGIANVLMALTLASMTDMWGEIPWSQALQAEEGQFNPTYDTQQQIYQEIHRLLDEAITLFGQTPVVPVRGEDLFYSGSPAAWTRAAYSLKARYHNRLSNIDPAGSAQAALAAAANGFTARANELTFRGYQTAFAHQHPWHREFNNRRHHAYSLRMLDRQREINDPRIPLWARPMPSGELAGQIIGAPNGTALNDQGGSHYSKLHANLIRPDAPLEIMTYPELMFIVAEANLRLGRSEEALQAHITAVDAALEQAGVAAGAAAEFMAQEEVVPADAANLTLATIMEQKWLALFPFQSIEAFSEWRRTGFPVLTNPQGEIVRRLPNAQREYDTNRENVPQVRAGIAISTWIRCGVWWDDGSEGC